MGVYPMLLDETCFFLAADFDGENWRDDARAFLETCRHLELPAALPAMITGFKISAGLSVIGSIIALLVYRRTSGSRASRI